MKTTKVSDTLTSEICLYGNREIGFSYLAMTRGTDRPFGPYDPAAPRPFGFDSLTDAVWSAAQAIRDRGVGGTVRIFAPGGHRYADAPLASVPSFGDLSWKAA